MILVTGSSGHLGEALVRVLRTRERPCRGLDRLPGAGTDLVGSVGDRALVRRALEGVTGVLHAATLHKPHVATHSREDFWEANCRATTVLLEEAVAAEVEAFVFTSSTTTFGYSLRPPQGDPAVWVTEDLRPRPRNIYGVTKTAAEDLCQLVHQDHGLPVVVLRTSRFFPEEDDVPERAAAFEDANLKANEFLHRRADLEDIVEAHLLGLERAPTLGFGRYIVSAPPPFAQEDVEELRRDTPAVVARYFPEQPEVYAARGWRLPRSLGRVYDSARAVAELGWQPRYDFARVLAQAAAGEPIGSELARQVGAKGYHRAGGE